MSNSSLIDFPVEIVHRIFDDIDTLTLIRSIRCVCKRFNEIVKSYNRFQIKLNLNDKFYLNLIGYFIQPSNIISLILINNDFNEETIKLFLLNFPFNQLIRLRSLTLVHLKIVQINKFLKDLNRTSLFSLAIHIHLQEESSQTFLELPSFVQQSNLIQLNLIDFNLTIIQLNFDQNQYKLEKLTIGDCTFEQYLTILNNYPQLKRFEITNCYMNNISQSNFLPSIVSKFNSSKRQRRSIELLSLTINNCQLSIEDLEILLRLTPSLIHLKITSLRSTFDRIFNGLYWKEFIETNLTLLNKFQFFFTYINTQYNVWEMNINEIISSFKNSFWIKIKQWFVTYEYIPKESKIQLYTKTMNQIKRISTLKISSTDSICRFILCPNNLTSKPFSTLSRLDFSCNRLEDSFIQYLINALKKFNSLTSIDLSRNFIRNIGAQYLADYFQNNQTLQVLNLSHNQISNIGIIYLYDTLKTNKKLILLELVGNIGNYYRCITAAIQIRNDKTLNQKNLQSINLEDNQIRFLVESLYFNQTLTQLNLSRNQINDIGAKRLSYPLRYHPSLITLDLSYNQISNNGMEYLYEILQENKTLINVNLKRNLGNYSTCVSIAFQICNDQTLNKINLQSNFIDNDQLKFLIESLNKNQTIIEFDLSKNLISHLGIAYLVNLLKINQTLEILNLSFNQINDYGVEQLLLASEKNKTLKELILIGNNISTEVKENIQMKDKRFCF